MAIAAILIAVWLAGPGPNVVTESPLDSGAGIVPMLTVICVLIAAGCGVLIVRRSRSAATLRARLGCAVPDVPVLGSIAPIAAARIDAALGGVVDDPMLAGTLAAIHDELLQHCGPSCRTILIASTEAGEGKSTFALNFAAALSRRARVMLVDADLRNPAVSRRVNLPRYDAGLTELIACEAPYRSCLALTSLPNLHVIRSGSLPDKPLDALRNPRLAMTLQLSERYYDHIVIDSPAIAEHPDAVLLAKIVDAVVVVVDARRRRLSRISGAVKLLKQVKAPIGGFVLNRAFD